MATALYNPVEWQADPTTDWRLLPPALRGADNSKRRAFYRYALRSILEDKLTPLQRRRYIQHYLQGISKTDIARREGSSHGIVARSLKVADEMLQEYADIYRDAYDYFERTLMDDAG
jgi:DNA-directed RNA polymerase specialized sigma24 family protein